MRLLDKIDLLLYERKKVVLLRCDKCGMEFRPRNEKQKTCGPCLLKKNKESNEETLAANNYLVEALHYPNHVRAPVCKIKTRGKISVTDDKDKVTCKKCLELLNRKK